MNFQFRKLEKKLHRVSLWSVALVQSYVSKKKYVASINFYNNSSLGVPKVEADFITYKKMSLTCRDISILVCKLIGCVHVFK